MTGSFRRTDLPSARRQCWRGPGFALLAPSTIWMGGCRGEGGTVTLIPETECWAGAAASELRKAADSVAAASIPEYLGEECLRFATLAENADGAIDRLTSEALIDRDRCLYVFTLDEDADPEALKIAFSDARERTDLKLPQYNKDVSGTLYVGSSCATRNRKRTLRNRLRQHLVRAPRGTYALSLAEWTSHLQGGLIVRAWQYPSQGDGEEGEVAARRVILAVEDWLAETLMPILGRRGSRY